jgi:small subunit ribosomal protein S11
MVKQKTAKKTKKVVTSGMASIQSTFNNTIITLTDENGEVLGQGSPSMVGFKGARRSTAFAATKQQWKLPKE